MPTMKQAEQIRSLLGAKEQIEEWMERIGSCTEPFIVFGQIATADREVPDQVEELGDHGSRSMTLPHRVAMRMLAGEIEAIYGDLRDLGVVNDQPIEAESH